MEKLTKSQRQVRPKLGTRKRLLMLGGLVPLALTINSAVAVQSPQVPIAGSSIPQFVDPLPDLVAVDGKAPVELHMKEFQAQVLPTGMPKTWVWGYLQAGQTVSASYIGPVIQAQRGIPTQMKMFNDLGTVGTTRIDAYRYGTDQTLHWADPLNNGMNMFNHMAMAPTFGSPGAQNYAGAIPAALHLHGGEVPPQVDGGPESWFTSDGLHVGSGYYSKDGFAAKNYVIYRYPNTQESAPLWFHDHTLGATRLNVYCGLAGAYLLADPANDPANLPPLIPLVLQDRMFDTAGQWFFPAGSAGGVLWALNPDHPYWVPEFIGDAIVVNGKTWPYKTVAPQRYTLLFLNGSNARTYEMALVDPVSKNPGPALWVIGTDGGYLDTPVKVDPASAGNNKLVVMPGERYTVVVDFAGYQAGGVGPNGVAYSGKWQIKNTAKAPYPGGAAPAGPLGKVLEFRVAGAPGIDTSFNPATATAVRPAPMVRLANPAAGALATGVTPQQRRQLTLNEIMGMPQKAIDPVTGLLTAYPGGPLEILVNNTKWDGQRAKGVMPMANGEWMYTREARADFVLDGLKVNYLSELPIEGQTESWEIINLTADAHPIHLHLIQFQLINRQAIDVPKYTTDYAAAFPGGSYDPMTGAAYPAGVFIPGFGPPLNYNTGNPNALGGNPDINAVNAKKRALYLQGLARLPLPQEAGWKDTIMVAPGQVTRLAVRWAPTTVPAGTAPSLATFPFDPNGGFGYVWHCHILDHEDNEMMRPAEVVPQPGAARTYLMGADY